MCIGVTFTGVDDKTDLNAVKKLWDAYDGLEFGILITNKDNKVARFPKSETVAEVSKLGIKLSFHLCGAVARAAIIGNWEPFRETVGDSVNKVARLQLNVSPYNNMPGIVLPQFENKEIIIQQKSTDTRLIEKFITKSKVGISCLIDSSGGRGKYEAVEHVEIPDIKCGFAGGLGSENCVAVVEKLMRLKNNVAWIDMESSLRDSNDQFNIEKCRCVCERLADAGMINRK